jgi:predicted secreted Zn-dependent protease
MKTKIDGPAAEVDPSAAELARANERHTALGAAEARKLNRIMRDAEATPEQRMWAAVRGVPVSWVMEIDRNMPKFVKINGGAL